MSEESKTPDPGYPPVQAKAQAKEPPKPKIIWKVVEPKHYQRAKEKKAAGGKAAYTKYVLSLVERFEGGYAEGLTKAQVEAVLSAFEEKYG